MITLDFFQVFFLHERVSFLLKLKTEEEDIVDGVKSIRTHYGREFDDEKYVNFCNIHGIDHEFCTPRTPHQNEIVKRKIRTVQETVRVMHHVKELPQKLWTEAVNPAVYLINSVYLHLNTNCTSYELQNGKKPSLSYLQLFVAYCIIKKSS